MYKIIIIWILFGLLLSEFLFFLFTFWIHKKSLKTLKTKIHNFNQYQKKFLNYTEDWVISLSKTNFNKFDTYDFINKFKQWKKIQSKWSDLINHAINISQTYHSYQFYIIIKKINYLEKKMNMFGNSLITYTDKLMNTDIVQNNESHILAINESLEEFFNYLNSINKYDMDAFNNIIINRNNIYMNIDKHKNNVSNEYIKQLIDYANLLMVYYQFNLTINHWICLEHEMTKLIEKGYIDKNFVLNLQINNKVFKKNRNNISTFIPTKINPQWKFIDKMHEQLNEYKKIGMLKIWLENNQTKINNIFKLVGDIYQLNNKFNNDPSKLLSIVDMNNWNNICNKIFNTYEQITNKKTSHIVIKESKVEVIKLYYELLVQINEFIDLSNELILQIDCKINYQQIINNLKINYNKSINNLLTNNNIENNKNQFLKQIKLLNTIHFPYNNNAIDYLIEISKTINKYNEIIYKDSSLELIVKFIHNDLKNKSKLNNDQINDLNNLYKNKHYTKYIQTIIKYI